MVRIRKAICFFLLGLFLTTPVSASGRYYAQDGDTLCRIAVSNNVSPHKVRTFNPDLGKGELKKGSLVIVPVSSAELRRMERETVRLINKERAERGLRPLRSVPRITRISRKKAEDLRDKNYFEHTSPTYGTPFQMLKYFGVSYHYAGENIAKGYDTPESVVKAWMNSKGHRENILNPNYTKIGIGCVDGVYGPYWVQLFLD